jgi:hypothetical protein
MYFSKVVRTNEIFLHQLPFLTIDNKFLNLIINKEIYQFIYDHIQINNSQIEFYNTVILIYIKAVLLGENVTIFTIGPRHCGKSFTLIGNVNSSNLDETGCIYKACIDLLNNLSNYNNKKGLFMAMLYVFL